jgi:hypothetical protein
LQLDRKPHSRHGAFGEIGTELEDPEADQVANRRDLGSGFDRELCFVEIHGAMMPDPAPMATGG